MFVNVRPAVSSRPWVAAGVALALMLSLMAVMAPAIATQSQPGTVTFVPEPTTLEPNDDNEVTFTVEVAGDFPVDTADLVAGVSGIVVEVALLPGLDSDVDSLPSETEEVSTVAGVSSASVTLSLDNVDFGTYDLRATARLVSPATEGSPILLESTTTSVDYFGYPEGVGEVREVTNGGFSASVDLEGEGRVFLGLLGDAFLDGTECPGEHTRLPETIFFDIIVPDDGAETAEVTVTLTREARTLEINNGVSQYQFCYLGGAEFTDRDGVLQTETAPQHLLFQNLPKLSYGPALLPDCSSTDPQAPCVRDRTSIRRGGAQFTLLVPTGDPMFR